jgi:Fe-S-cluster-containing hydrogenase component 2
MSLYEKLSHDSEILFGEVPNRERVVWALSQTIPEEDLRVYFLLPFGSQMPLEKLRAKAARLGLSPQRLEETLERLYREAFVMCHQKDGGLAYERCPLSMLAEQQVRMRKGTEIGRAYADYWLSLANHTAFRLPTRTPYFRVLPVEGAIRREPYGDHAGKETVRVAVNEPIPDPREVLPLDVVSEIVRGQRVVGIANCYCRLACDMQGDPCEKPRETCFVFNEFAESLFSLGIARRLALEEALAILQRCEAAGLVHNVDNFQGQIRGLCNCCGCHCPGLKAAAKGAKNVEATSRYTVAFDAEKCIADHACAAICPIQAVQVGADGLPLFDRQTCFGCGLCVSACPEGALRMQVREKAPRVPATAQALQDTLMREAVAGLVWNKLTGKK